MPGSIRAACARNSGYTEDRLRLGVKLTTVLMTSRSADEVKSLIAIHDDLMGVSRPAWQTACEGHAPHAAYGPPSSGRRAGEDRPRRARPPPRPGRRSRPGTKSHRRRRPATETAKSGSPHLTQGGAPDMADKTRGKTAGPGTGEPSGKSSPGPESGSRRPEGAGRTASAGPGPGDRAGVARP